MDVPKLADQSIDERTLRHSGERVVFFVFVVLNFAILAGAVWVMRMHPPWLGRHPFVDKQVATLRALAIAGAVAAPWTVLMRNMRWAAAYSNSIPLSERQVPVIYDLLVHHCAVFGMPIPELYVADKETHIARGYSIWGRSYIVLNNKLLQPDMKPLADVIGFHLGREVGRLRLGHATWWNELLLSYVVRIPVIRNPLMHLRTFSADRYGAFLQPDGVRGLLAHPTGRVLLPGVDVAEYLAHVPAVKGFVASIAILGQDQPPIAHRIKALYDLGLFTNKN